MDNLGPEDAGMPDGFSEGRVVSYQTQYLGPGGAVSLRQLLCPYPIEFALCVLRHIPGGLGWAVARGAMEWRRGGSRRGTWRPSL